MQRGEIWTYEAKGPRGARTVLIVSGYGINDDPRRRWLIGVDIVPDDPGDLLAVPIPGHGWADASTLTRLFRRWLGHQIDTLEPDLLERVDIALRAALDL